jgi:hypothetical protein
MKRIEIYIDYRGDGGLPLYWRDPDGHVHACEALEAPGVRLAGTLCGLDVPENGACEADGLVVTCPGCTLELVLAMTVANDP